MTECQSSIIRRFDFDFRSTVTIVTTAAEGPSHSKNARTRGIFTGVVIDETQLTFRRSSDNVSVFVDGVQVGDEAECECEECCGDGHEPEKSKDTCEWCPPEKDDDCDKKHDHVKKPGKWLVLSLTCPSFPYCAGQIVWINVKQIVAVAEVCKD